MKRFSASARWITPIVLLLVLALLMAACERPLQELPEATEPATATQPGEQPTVPAPPTPELPATGGEELPPVGTEGTEGETPTDGETVPVEGTDGSTGDATDSAGEGETPTAGETDSEGLAEDGTYTVQAGDTLYKIATSYGLTVDELAAANGITNVNLIDVGDVLVIPSASGAGDDGDDGVADEGTDSGDEAATDEGTVAEGEEQTYIVKPGDILGTIAQQFGVPLADLLAYNDMDANTIIFPGDELKIPPPGWTAPEQ